VIDSVSGDAYWRAHPTPILYGFESYISLPITLSDGRFFGTLCAIDPAPAKIDVPELIATIRGFAAEIAAILDASTSDRVG
jgi:GAF domain-containing protein